MLFMSILSTIFLFKQELIHEEQFFLQCTHQVIRFSELRASIHTAYKRAKSTDRDKLTTNELTAKQ